MRLKADGAACSYDGDLTITISPGLDITIPNHQLVKPDFTFNNQPSIIEPNATSRELLFNSLQGENENDFPTLGRPFFSSSYLFVDEDKAQFTLWGGNPTATEKKIVPVGAATCDPDINITTPSPTAPAAKTPNADKTMNTGGIAGVIIGSLAGIIVVSFLLFRLYRRRQRPPVPSSKPEKEDPRLSSYLSLKAEMPTDKQPPQEMPSERNPGYAVTPYEMAVEPHEMPAGPATGSLGQGRWHRLSLSGRRGEGRQNPHEML